MCIFAANKRMPLILTNPVSASTINKIILDAQKTMYADPNIPQSFKDTVVKESQKSIRPFVDFVQYQLDNCDSDNLDTYYDTITSMAREFLNELKATLDKNNKLTIVSIGNSWMAVLSELCNNARQLSDDTFYKITNQLHRHSTELIISYI
jgi:hypothetical protein